MQVSNTNSSSLNIEFNEKTPLLKEFELSPERSPNTPANWSHRVIKQLDSWENSIADKVPGLTCVQNRIDHLGDLISQRFSLIDQWLKETGHGDWYQQFGIFVAKLPVKIAKNIINMLYNIVAAIVYAVNHPTRAAFKVAKMLVQLVEALTHPATWSKIGAGMMGGSLGQAAVGNPLSVIGIAIGAACLAVGLTSGALLKAYKAVKGERLKAAGEEIYSQLKDLPETFLTGFCVGLIFGAIQKAARDKAVNEDARFRREHRDMQLRQAESRKEFLEANQISTQEQAEAAAFRFLKENNLPKPDYVYFHEGKVLIKWNHYWGRPCPLKEIMDNNSNLQPYWGHKVDDLLVTLDSNSSSFEISYTNFEDITIRQIRSLEEIWNNTYYPSKIPEVAADLPAVQITAGDGLRHAGAFVAPLATQKSATTPHDYIAIKE